MQEPRVSPHLEARVGKNSDELLFINLAFGTRILGQEDSWNKLASLQKGEADLDDPWLQRTRRAKVVQTGTEEWPDFVQRLDLSMREYIAKHTGEELAEAGNKEQLLKRLEQTEALYREHSSPHPYKGPDKDIGPLMKSPVRLVDFIFDHTRAFLENDLEDTSPDLNLDLVRQFFDRPALKLRYEQQFCIPRTTQLRAQRIIEVLKPGSRVLVLGDDDLVGLALVELSDDLHVDILELDSDLVNFLQERSRGRFTILEHNLRHGVPDSMKDCYDAVTTDPPYADDGMRFFLECAKVSLKKEAESRLFLSTYPGLLESPDRFWQDLKDLEFEIHHQREHFSRYVYNNLYRVQHLAAFRYLGSPINPTTDLIGFPFLYAHFFECGHQS
jgi:Branched-chain polyamine synthase A C-terminal domain